jgi:hypothetical protein
VYDQPWTPRLATAYRSLRRSDLQGLPHSNAKTEGPRAEGHQGATIRLEISLEQDSRCVSGFKLRAGRADPNVPGC